MDAKLEDNKLIVKDKEGNTKEFAVLISMDSEDNTKSYIVFSDLSKNENGEVEIHANIYEPNKSEFKLYPIETDEEWKMVNKVVKSAMEAVKEGM